MRGVAGLPSEGNGEAPADEEPELNPGKCSDCRREVPARRRYGEAPQEGGGIGLALCRRCYRSRERVSREVEQAKATAGPAPRPDPEAGPAEGGEAEA
jgi:hypothetical protein